MKIQMIGKTQGVFKVEIETNSPGQFRLFSENQQAISASTEYIDEIVEMLVRAKKILKAEEA